MSPPPLPPPQKKDRKTANRQWSPEHIETSDICVCSWLQWWCHDPFLSGTSLLLAWVNMCVMLLLMKRNTVFLNNVDSTWELKRKKRSDKIFYSLTSLKPLFAFSFFYHRQTNSQVCWLSDVALLRLIIKRIPVEGDTPLYNRVLLSKAPSCDGLPEEIWCSQQIYMIMYNLWRRGPITHRAWDKGTLLALLCIA